MDKKQIISFKVKKLMQYRDSEGIIKLMLSLIDDPITSLDNWIKDMKDDTEKRLGEVTKERDELKLNRDLLHKASVEKQVNSQIFNRDSSVLIKVK